MDSIESLIASLYKEFSQTHGNDTFFHYATWILEICDRVLEKTKGNPLISKNTRQVFSYANEWLRGELSYDDFCTNCYSMKDTTNLESTLHVVIYNLIDFGGGDSYFGNAVEDAAYQFAHCERKLMEFLHGDIKEINALRMDNAMKLIALFA